MGRSDVTRKFKDHHLKKSCPKCKAFIGSRCRGPSGIGMTMTHTERVKATRGMGDRVRGK